VYISWRRLTAVCVTECTLSVRVVYRGLLGVLRCGIWRCWTVYISWKRQAAVCVTECTLGVPVCTMGVRVWCPWSGGCVEVWDLETRDCVRQLEMPDGSLCD